MDIRPPTCFSPRNVLHTMALKNDCLRLFPPTLYQRWGGPSTPTTHHTKLARANDQDPRLPMSSASPPPMTFPSPTLQPFTIESGTSTYSWGDFNDSFRDNGAILGEFEQLFPYH